MAADSSAEEAQGSLLIGGLHAAVRLDAPAEVLAGAWLRARVVLAVSREDARLRAEWRLLLDGVGCRASVSGTNGALLPIAAEMQRTPEPDGVRRLSTPHDTTPLRHLTPPPLRHLTP
ncbi:hypothetical protein AB1Y20_007734 [Prymnesium parvum]|uniref:Uncharacterized protein n=1 Tax=Prymnesium parvum TaxID=97485 RepID=A0AB34IVV7_PRYPA